MRGVRRRNRKSSDLRLDTNNVRFIFPPAETVLSVGHRLDGAGDGVLVWRCRQSHRVVCARRCRRGDILVGTVALVRPLFRPLRRNLRRRLDGVRAASLGAVVHPRFRADPVHFLFSGPGQRRHQQLVRAVLRSRPGRAFEIEAGHGRAVLQRIVDLRRHRPGRGRGRRDDAVLCQPLHLPLADRDERLLHRKLATTPHHRGRLAAGAGGHHAVCDHHGRSRRQSDQCRADALGLPAGPREALQQCHGAAVDRLDPLSLVFAAVIWSVLGTGALALIGIRLPGIEFFNQRVEAAYRKELVLGEDDPARADPPTVSELFGAIRRNYFRLYLNFMYFNIGRIVYLQTDVIFPYILLGPTIIAGKITLGSMNQILNAFTQVRTSFQYLVNSWSTIVELISIYQRLRGFEAKIGGEPLPSIETRTEPKSL